MDFTRVRIGSFCFLTMLSRASYACPGSASSLWLPGWPRQLNRRHLTTAVCLWLAVLEKSEFKDESQFFRFHADEEMEGTSSKNKQLRNDFKLVENILAKRLLVGTQ